MVYLSNISAALPESPILPEKGIKSVFSLVQFAELNTPYRSMTSLYSGDETHPLLFADGLDVVVHHEESGVLYYDLNIADISNPANLETHKQYPMTAFDVFCRAVVFITERLKYGNVLIHCEQGRRRSPTAFLAFLVSNGVRVHQAIQILSSGYSGEEDWAIHYSKHRSLWIERLAQFEFKHPSLCAAFKMTHPKMIKAFHGAVWTEEDEKEYQEKLKSIESSASPSIPSIGTLLGYNESQATKKRPGASDLSQNKTAPASKKYKLVTSTMLPSRWAQKK